jgi:hypothetical protein
VSGCATNGSRTLCREAIERADVVQLCLFGGLSRMYGCGAKHYLIQGNFFNGIKAYSGKLEAESCSSDERNDR